MRFAPLLLLLFLLCRPVLGAALSARDVAVLEATAFVELLDQQRYTDAWQVGTAYFRQQLPLKKWRQVLKRHREPLGKVQERNLVEVRHLDGFASAPPGLYMRVEYRTLFAGREHRETLAVFKDFDGRWRVANYQLR